MTFRIAHVTDVHVMRVDTLRRRDYLSKRVTGAANAAFGRGRYGSGEILEALIRSVRDEAADHLAITGDLTQLALPAEFEEAHELVTRLGMPADNVSIIPGNHDCYTKDVDRDRVFDRTFARYLKSEAPFPPWPVLKFDGPLAVIGLNTAVATPVFFASGSLGREQLARCDDILGRGDVRERFVVVLIHHAVLRGVQKLGWLRGLTDGPEFLQIVARHKVDVILHGHEHRRLCYQVPMATGPCTVICGGSASRLSAEAGRGAQYNVYWIESGRLERAETREFLTEQGRFVPRAIDISSPLADGALSAGVV